jgi:spore coat polysaccharide biosynthesis protein SpsF
MAMVAMPNMAAMPKRLKRNGGKGRGMKGEMYKNEIQEVNLGVIIQARLGSSRLPGKILLPFGDSTLIEEIWRKASQLGLPTVVATTANDRDNRLVEFLQLKRINYSRGSEENVLERFISAGEEYGFSHVLRICSDNPFLNFEYLKKLVRQFDAYSNYDYVSFEYNEKPSILSHFGIFAEIVSMSALYKIREKFNANRLYQEHVTIGVYSNPDLFRINLIPLESEYYQLSGLRLTIDTQADYEVMQLAYERYGDRLFNFLSFAQSIIKDQELVGMMKSNIELNQK